ncbi:uncharacterized protein K452DRAFT_303228 [Aplosporella prunicola CBS 121167]|uniref:Uncharacterized protein n=1 Tax=Aplosporella prunicola CBS 121167 TaxID=1176127 RepID=A0A6A6AW05_9PEZI|nr:uncharacterized protein K452DRAFT_303228 [Aplosporella prunicola CBS 121167]KAF2135880.1 hypothetical protein K452DRAFT_303228 [Aplosporella prunicola CBS 121167]
MGSMEFVQIELFGSDVSPTLFSAAKIRKYEALCIMAHRLYNKSQDAFENAGGYTTSTPNDLMTVLAEFVPRNQELSATLERITTGNDAAAREGIVPSSITDAGDNATSAKDTSDDDNTVNDNRDIFGINAVADMNTGAASINTRGLRVTPQRNRRPGMVILKFTRPGALAKFAEGLNPITNTTETLTIPVNSPSHRAGKRTGDNNRSSRPHKRRKPPPTRPTQSIMDTIIGYGTNRNSKDTTRLVVGSLTSTDGTERAVYASRSRETIKYSLSRYDMHGNFVGLPRSHNVGYAEVNFFRDLARLHTEEAIKVKVIRQIQKLEDMRKNDLVMNPDVPPSAGQIPSTDAPASKKVPIEADKSTVFSPTTVQRFQARPDGRYLVGVMKSPLPNRDRLNAVTVTRFRGDRNSRVTMIHEDIYGTIIEEIPGSRPLNGGLVYEHEMTLLPAYKDFEGRPDKELRDAIMQHATGIHSTSEESQALDDQGTDSSLSDVVPSLDHTPESSPPHPGTESELPVPEVTEEADPSQELPPPQVDLITPYSVGTVAEVLREYITESLPEGTKFKFKVFVYL